MPSDDEEMSAVDLLNYMQTDAQKWAQEFKKQFPARAGQMDESTLVGWFANAIEAGRTAGHNAAFEEMKHAARNMGFDTSEVYSPGQLIEFVQTFRSEPQ